ncbi:hypothetical protein [Arthrobacter sp. AZCC_0090]|uniref:hypothetical protein n=1 Tax=Arthrobacter sp. AZCC_0090 TaxID=2735881 RepID=UPI0016193F3B|nr:hypothetical protein [Arthrobacter sp. AZCC_0090]MBB6405972.1 hypothetical protein [Arthrobacter sp. AZCC_0090]
MNQGISDPVMGNSAQIESVVANFTPPSAVVHHWAALHGGQVVLVTAKVSTGSKFYSSFGADNFYIVGANGGASIPTISGGLDDLLGAVKDAGYGPLFGDEGWMVFILHTPQTKLTLGYERQAAGTSDGQNITKQNFDVPLN